MRCSIYCARQRSKRFLFNGAVRVAAQRFYTLFGAFQTRQLSTLYFFSAVSLTIHQKLSELSKLPVKQPEVNWWQLSRITLYLR